MLIPSPVLVICAGNLCRSPFAEGYMRKRFEAAGAPVEVFSRGLLALPNQRPPLEAREAARVFGVDLSGHVAQPLLGGDLDRAGLVLVMSPDQRKHLARMKPAAIGKVFLLSQPADGAPVPDPMGRDAAFFEQVYADIAALVDAWLTRFGVAAA